MNSDDLECFARVARCGSFSRAAMELGSDQSTISRQMARLEAESQTRLFHRSGRGVDLTEAGRTLLDYAGKVSATLAEARRAVNAASGEGPAQIVIAAQPTIANTTFAAIGTALKRQFPKTRIRFVEGLGSHMVAWLASGEVDIAVLYMPAHAGGLKVDPLLQERISLIAPADHVHIGAEFAFADLASVPLVLPSTHHGLRVMSESLAASAHIALDIAMECDASTSVTKRMVQQGCGCTLLPLAAVTEEIAQGKLRAATLTGPEMWRDVAIATAKNRAPLAELWDITRTVRHEIEQIVGNGGWPDARLTT